MSTSQEPTVADFKEKWPPTQETIETLYASERIWPGASAEVTGWRSDVVSHMSKYVTEFDQKYTEMVGLHYPNGKPANANTKGWSACRKTLGWKALDDLDRLFHETYDEYGPGYLTYRHPVVEREDPGVNVTATIVFYWGKQPEPAETAKVGKVYQEAPNLYLSTAPGAIDDRNVGHGSSEEYIML